MVLPEKQLRELALFAGAGGGILGGMLHGWRTVAAVEIEDYPRRVLLQRQADGILPRFPVWDDVRTFDGKQWRGKVDVVSGGFPCQDISAAGKGQGLSGKKSSLWFEMARIISEVRPKHAFVENSPMLISRGLTTVLGDFAEMGYDARWCVLGGLATGGKCEGKRLWLAATDKARRGKLQKEGSDPGECKIQSGCEWYSLQDSKKDWLEANSYIVRKDFILAHWVDRVEAIGNGQDPILAARAWEILTGK